MAVISFERAFLRLIKNTTTSIVDKKVIIPVMPPISTILVEWFMLESLLVVLEDGV